ncbi:unnamed protein product [Acanthoscelides obtectus]|uniref:Uncharacterized protein n=1 Tax=Acanthoscelides obtectus TaxID=200917 RepID=A0A9P0PZ07_ACAOB|nr:unnamed protein product [Acanthoscelides obtectus]CAK1665460.1 hypothetical protein AOBTE_LOCUS24831 [Acanthoscelides obtectus]
MFSSVKYCLVFWAVSWWRMILLSGLIFRSSVMAFGKQMVVYQSAVTVVCSLRGIVAI